MSIKNYFEKKKQLKEEKERLLNELKNQAKQNVLSWYKAYGDKYEPAGVGFIMPDKYEIETVTSSYRHDQAAGNLFYKYYNKNMSFEAEKYDMPWYMMMPKKYNTVAFHLVSPYNMGEILMFLPEQINEYQISILKKIGEEVAEYNKDSKLKVKFNSCIDPEIDTKTEFNNIDEMLEHFYGKEINEGSEYNAKI